MGEFTHFNKEGEAVMVDVSEKNSTSRTATAQGEIHVSGEVMKAVQGGSNKKGDVLGIARVAGIMATKKTSELIPLCHPLALTKVTVDFQLLPDDGIIIATCTAKVEGKTGVEMEALTGVNVSLLTIYDMCKAIDKSMEMHNIHLLHKSGGKSGEYHRKED